VLVRLCLTDYAPLYSALAAVACLLTVCLVGLIVCGSSTARKAYSPHPSLGSIREGVYELVSRHDLRVLSASIVCLFAGFVGCASILSSYIQTAFHWRQGRIEMLVITAGAPAVGVSALVMRRIILPWRGEVAALQAGFASVAAGVATLCALPWFEYAVVFFIILGFAGAASFPIIFVLLAKRFPQHQSAQAIGLIEVAVVVSIGVAVPGFSFMYHAGATDKVVQAVPFIVGAGCAAIGALIILRLDRTPPTPLISQLPVTNVSADATPSEGGREALAVASL
jgi:predicted MFS family arabinose efflux permease